MGINRQDSRHRIKRTNLTGVVPTSHTASTDFTDGTWLNTDLREAELFYNIPDMRLWIGTGTSSIEIAQIGSTTSGNSLEQTLAIGNNSGTYNIIMGTSTVIKSASNTNEIKLNGYGGILMTTDSGAWTKEVLYISPGYVELSSYTSNSVLLSGNDKAMFGFIGSPLSVSKNGIFINTTGSDYVSNGNEAYPMSINSQNSTIWASATNSVIIGGVDINNAIASNSVYVPDLYIQGGKSIKSLNGNSSIMLDTSGLSNNIFISTDGLGSEASIEMTPSSFSLYNSTGNITIGASIYNISLSSNVEISTGKSIKFDYTTITTGSISSSTIGTFSMATFSMANNSSISIKGHANGYCNSPNRNMGSTFYASFIKYGGSIYQNGTTDIVLKDGYGDGTTPAVWTDGTTIYISIRTFSALVSTFTTSYEKLI